MPKKGLGTPLSCDQHQDIVDFLYGNLKLKLKKNALPFLRQNRTADSIKGKCEIVPDICLFSKMDFDKDRNCWRYDDIVMCIEVVRNHSVDHSVESIEKIFSLCTSLKEAFLYNYESRIWIRYTRQDDGKATPEESDFSEIFNMHLDKLAIVGNSIEDILKIC